MDQLFIIVHCNVLTLIEGNKLFITVSLVLLDRKSTFEVFKIINLPIPYPEVGGKGVVVAWYKLETENIVFNVKRTKFMMLTLEEVMTCRMNVLGTCPSCGLSVMCIGII